MNTAARLYRIRKLFTMEIKPEYVLTQTDFEWLLAIFGERENRFSLVCFGNRGLLDKCTGYRSVTDIADIALSDKLLCPLKYYRP